jgi:hypothetical protein
LTCKYFILKHGLSSIFTAINLLIVRVMPLFKQYLSEIIGLSSVTYECITILFVFYLTCKYVLLIHKQCNIFTAINSLLALLFEGKKELLYWPTPASHFWKVNDLSESIIHVGHWPRPITVIGSVSVPTHFSWNVTY